MVPRPLDVPGDVTLDQPHRGTRLARRRSQHLEPPGPGQRQHEHCSGRGARPRAAAQRAPQQHVEQQQPQRHQGHAPERSHLQQRDHGVLGVAGLEPREAQLARGAQLLDRDEGEREAQGERQARVAGQRAGPPGGEAGVERQVGGGGEPRRVLEPRHGDRDVGEPRDPVGADEVERRAAGVAQAEQPAAARQTRLEGVEQRHEREPGDPAGRQRQERRAQQRPREERERDRAAVRRAGPLFPAPPSGRSRPSAP